MAIEELYDLPLNLRLCVGYRPTWLAGGSLMLSCSLCDMYDASAQLTTILGIVEFTCFF